VQLSSLYRITSHNQIVDVDDASTSPNNVSNQVMIFDNEIPEPQLVKKFIENTSVGTIIVVDAFDKQPFKTFDSINGAEAKLKVLNQIIVDGHSAILCLPDDYLTFYLGQVLDHKAKIFTIKAWCGHMAWKPTNSPPAFATTSFSPPSASHSLREFSGTSATRHTMRLAIS
jgi:hypothetical protein